MSRELALLVEPLHGRQLVPGAKPIEILHENSTTGGYAENYRRFIETLRPPKDYLDQMYDSRFARHFYSRDEIVSFRARWE